MKGEGTKKEEPTKPEFEKISSLTIRMDRLTSKFFDGFILFFFFWILLTITYSTSQYDPEEIDNIFRITTYAFFFPSFGLMILGGLTFFISTINTNIRKYDIFESIKFYFYELSKFPERKRRDELLKHLTFDIWSLRKKYFSQSPSFMKTPSISIFIFYRRKENAMILDIIDRILNLITDPTFYWIKFDYSKMFQQFGDCFKTKEYHKMLDILENNKDKFTKYDDFKNEFEKKSIKKKAKSIGIWLSKHGKEIITLIGIITVISSYILSILGYTPYPINLN